jgi:hypothetical protein
MMILSQEYKTYTIGFQNFPLQKYEKKTTSLQCFVRLLKKEFAYRKHRKTKNENNSVLFSLIISDLSDDGITS